jgi:hypothetical protein
VYQREQGGRGQGEHGQHFGGARDGRAPLEPEHAQHGRDKGAGDADADKVDKVGDIDRPHDRPVQSGDAYAPPHLVEPGQARRQHCASQDEEKYPVEQPGTLHRLKHAILHVAG